MTGVFSCHLFSYYIITHICAVFLLFFFIIYGTSLSLFFFLLSTHSLTQHNRSQHHNTTGPEDDTGHWREWSHVRPIHFRFEGGCTVTDFEIRASYPRFITNSVCGARVCVSDVCSMFFLFLRVRVCVFVCLCLCLCCLLSLPLCCVCMCSLFSFLYSYVLFLTILFSYSPNQLTDLLNPSTGPLAMRFSEQRGFFVENLTVVQCHTVDDLMAVVKEGVRNRHVSAHQLNKDSSRSHAAMTVCCFFVMFCFVLFCYLGLSLFLFRVLFVVSVFVCLFRRSFS